MSVLKKISQESIHQNGFTGKKKISFLVYTHSQAHTHIVCMIKQTQAIKQTQCPSQTIKVWIGR